jgi:hypothetical protein
MGRVGSATKSAEVFVLSPQQQRRADRLKELAERGTEIARLEVNHPGFGSWIQDEVPLHEWLVQVKNIIETTFGKDSPQTRELRRLDDGGVVDAKGVTQLIGLLRGSHGDLIGGFLARQEFLFAGEVFDSVLSEAGHLVGTSHKDAAAVLGRLVLEDAVKRLARLHSIEGTTASRLNDGLKAAGVYGQPQWRQVQAWLDIGNAAAHGEFDQYNSDQVRALLNGVEAFLASNFRAA